MITLFGIPNCDTVKKARTWLNANGIAHAFHDYKKAGVDRAKLKLWCDAKGWEVVINRAGTTFKKLPDADKADLTQDKAIELMMAHPSMIKRPVIETPTHILIGFTVGDYEKACL